MAIAAISPTPTYKPLVKKGWNAHVWYVESKSRPGYFHMVNAQLAHCTCEAGKYGHTCWHLTLCRALEGVTIELAPSA